MENIRIGDLDFDGKQEIAVTQLIDNTISIFKNQSTLTQIKFTKNPPIPTEVNPWGLDFGDLDGDGKTDIVVASVVKNKNAVPTANLSIFNNNSTSGNLVFTKSIAPTTYINKHIKMGDVDGDGKHDIAFTSIDDGKLGIPASKVSFFRNSTCMIPQVTPAGPLTICTGFPLRLFATIGRGTTYDWKKDGTTVLSGIAPFLDITASGDYTVTAISEGGACSKISNIIKVVVAGAGSTSAVASNNGPVCVGNALTLAVTDVGATQYLWTGPANYSSTGLTPAPIANFQLVNAGRYSVDIVTGSCLAQQTSTLVEANDVPDFNIVYTGSEVICVGDTKLLSVNPTPAGFTYQWFEKTTGAIAGAVASTYTASASGEYYVQAKPPSAGCASVNSNSVKLTIATPPVVSFASPTSACAGQNVQFIDQSSTDSQTTAFYAWNFGDATTSTDKNPIHNYSAANTYSVSLTVSYTNNGCLVTKTQGISITAAPVVAITNPENKYVLCKGESLKLEVLGTFTSYLWNTGSADPSITVSVADTYSVDVKATNGCLLSATKVITSFDVPNVSISATPDQINEGETSQLSASGLNSYIWSPAETLSDATIPNPVATPLVTTVYTVTGSDANCTYEETIEVYVTGEAIVAKLGPSNFFSPNSDNQNDFWLVEKISQYPQCSVHIYDDKGVKVFEAKPYLNNWDGNTTSGKRLPDGVYQYIIRCDGEENKPRKGSITILR